MSDYKYWMQVRAEELAQEAFGKDFYDLPVEQQDVLFAQAMDEYAERCTASADYLRDRQSTQ